MCFELLSELYNLPSKKRWGSKKKIVERMLMHYRLGDLSERRHILGWAIERVCSRKTKRKVLVLLCAFLQDNLEHLDAEQRVILRQALHSRK